MIPEIDIPGHCRAAIKSLPEMLVEQADTTQYKSIQHYNDNVMVYNTKTETVPSNIIAGMFGFKPKDFFELVDEEQREAPKVDFTS